MKNELRLGNWVNYEATAHYITGLMSNGLVYSRWSKQTSDERDYQHTYLDITPIPLTIELLEKCGFQFSDSNEWYKFYDLGELRCFIHQDNSKHVFCTYSGVSIDTRTSTFHQLQNLYFALTGEELNINL